ncbi:phage major capsid protein [Streptococcus suis]|uniref:Predicted phage phi-C31 gp36 major capsid-like protein n=1 Tax=Streptococcus suis TaxID=1307 RepID=A0AB33U7S8_STRSU|nr:phage major capsid protein [Streptococcus suis]QBX30975.1 major capsid protein [Streptococcus phage Javan584]MBO4115008.1 phage major capsid protein [Streptococcus suis]MBO4117126.1 phage major capsid protein [Streptococcus suis]MBO4128199.1 phage major capsid protein [Streptococcus suis]NQS05850.1 phage major capsid protein [Streptococcus suis]
MVIDLKAVPKYRAAVGKLSAEISNGASQERQEELFNEAFNILGTEINEMASDKLEKLFNFRDANRTLSTAELNFFNEVVNPEDPAGVKTEKLIPEEMMIQVFDELKEEHELLSVINFKTTGINAKALISETDGVAVWGEIYSEIKGQLKQKFDEVDFGMNKLTAFVVLPKDALKFSYSWLKQFVIEQIKEAMAVALELAIVKGDGFKQPVGLIKKIGEGDEVVRDKVITYPTDKDAIADLSTINPENAPKILAPVMKYLSKNDKDRRKKIRGKVRILVSPDDHWDLEARFTKLTDGGAYVTTVPYGIKFIETLALENGKAIAFVTDRYDALMATNGSLTIEEFDQTFALEDWMLYTAKGYYYGKAKDNHASAVLTVTGG